MFLILANGVQPCGTFEKADDAKTALAALVETNPESTFVVFEQVHSTADAPAPAPAPDPAPEAGQGDADPHHGE